MLTKKSVVILVAVAIVLAGVAIALQSSSDNTETIPTSNPASVSGNVVKSGSVGLEITQQEIEDKLKE